MLTAYLRTLAIFSAPILLLLVVMEVGLRNIPNDYSYKHDRLVHDGSMFRSLVLGHSHSYKGVDPEVLGMDGFSAANIAQDLSYDRAILERYIQYLPNLEYLILPITYRSLGNSLIDGPEPWRVKNYNLYMGIDHDVDQLSDRLELLNRPMAQQVDMLWRYFVHGKDNRSCKASGVASEQRRTNMNMEETGEKAAARHFSPSVERNQQGISDLRAILSIASSRGVKVVLVTTPTWRTYRDRLDSTQLSEMVNTCEGMARTIAGVEYFNFHDDPRFLESDFEDADHLSASGCVKFSKLLGRSISAGPSTPRPVTEQTRSK